MSTTESDLTEVLQALRVINKKTDALLEMNGNPYYDQDGNLRVQSGNFNVFHGKGVLKASVFLPRRGSDGFVTKEGALFIEAANAKGKRSDGLPDYDWDNKVTFSLGPADIAKLVDPTVDQPKLFHKDQKNRDNPRFDKSLTISPPSGGYNTYNVNIEDRVAGSGRIFVPMDPGQYQMFQRLLLGSLPLLLGWPR